MTVVSRGLDAYVAVDASGTFSETKREAGLLRMTGVVVSDHATLMVEILKDNGRQRSWCRVRCDRYGVSKARWSNR